MIDSFLKVSLLLTVFLIPLLGATNNFSYEQSKILFFIFLTMLLSDFNKEQGFREPVDMNGDKKINTFDFALMRKTLLQNGVIKGQ